MVLGVRVGPSRLKGCPLWPLLLSRGRTFWIATPSMSSPVRHAARYMGSAKHRICLVQSRKCLSQLCGYMCKQRALGHASEDMLATIPDALETALQLTIGHIFAKRQAGLRFMCFTACLAGTERCTCGAARLAGSSSCPSDAPSKPTGTRRSCAVLEHSCSCLGTHRCCCNTNRPGWS